MHNLPLRVVRRYSAAKLLLYNQTDSGSRSISLCKAKCRIQTVILDEEKYHCIDTMHSEQQTLSWLHTVAPGFPINGSNVKVIYEPNIFYSTLLEKCRSAKKRITLASLYLGTGELEGELVKAIEQAVNVNNGNVQVKILLDFMRGSRGKLNSRKMLSPLLNGKHGSSCQVFLYHTPKLRGLLKAIVPDRFNELIGLQHMKLYMIDDDIIISGANLSNDYFTNRQDRYVLIEDCKELCDFYNNLVERVGEFSYTLQPDGGTVLSSAKGLDPVKDSRKKFVDKAATSIRSLFEAEIDKRKDIGKTEGSSADTWVFPLIEMGQLNIRHDSLVTLKLLETAPEGSTLRLATGYFNLTPDYMSAVLKRCRATCQLLTAHPTANGFFGAKGIAGGIPAAYTKIEDSFCKRCENFGQEKRVTLWEFVKSGWTYHAKGLWYTLPGQEKPSLTLIGSPNFGYRSVMRDLETQVAVVTKNKDLQEALEKEHSRLFTLAHPVSRETFSKQDRIPPTWVCAVVALFRYYF